MTQPGGGALWLIHALGSSARQWNDVAASPRLAGYAKTAPDLPGSGDEPSRPGVTLAQLAREIASEIGSSSRRTVLVGHSLGGVLATLVAEQRPRELVAVVNVEGNLTLADCTASAAAVSAPDFAVWLDRLVEICATGTEPFRRLSTWLRTCDPTTFLEFSRELVRLSTDAAIGNRYASLSLPCLYLRGDNGFPAESIAFIKQHSLRERVIPGASHLLPWERPEEVSAAIADFAGEVVA